MAARVDTLQHLEALAVVGGVQYVYVYSRLLAAATWQRYFGDDALDGQSGRELRRCLLEGAQACMPGVEIVKGLLGQESMLAVGGGWIPDLGADVFQELDLLG